MDPDHPHQDATAWFEALFDANYGDLMRYATRREEGALEAWMRAQEPWISHGTGGAFTVHPRKRCRPACRLPRTWSKARRA